MNEYGDTPDINTRTEGGAVVKISSNENDEREAYKIEWGRAHPELGGDETHVFLEEMYHAGQILEYENNNGTITQFCRSNHNAFKRNN